MDRVEGVDDSVGRSDQPDPAVAELILQVCMEGTQRGDRARPAELPQRRRQARGRLALPILAAATAVTRGEACAAREGGVACARSRCRTEERSLG
jgi:hypothetical protein